MRLNATRLGSIASSRSFGDQLDDLAGQVPSLDLNFAQNKSLIDDYSGTTLVTHTRASSGTYVDSEGVIRQAVTNLLLRSEEFDNASWAKGDVTVQENAALAPNGSTLADKLIASATTAVHNISQAVTASSAAHTFSIYLKAAELTTVSIRAGRSGNFVNADINLSLGTIASPTTSGTATNVSSSIQSVSNDWYRCSVTGSNLGDGQIAPVIYIPDDASLPGDGTSGIYVWGAQLEQSSTVGEYIPTTSTINSAPRFDHDPTTGESLGLLVEEARTNLSQQSEDFSNVYWTKTDCTITANDSTAPDGTTTADLWTNVLSGGGAINNSITKDATARTYTSSMWVKGTVSLFTLTLDFGGTANRGRVQFNLVTNTVIGTTNTGNFTGTSGSITVYPNGWARLIMTTTTSTGTTIRFRPFFGTGGESVHIWGAQVEEGSFPTSYIPTSGSSATRTQDNASISGASFNNFYNQTEGTIVSRFKGGRRFIAPSSTQNWSRVVGYGSASRALLSSGNTGNNNIHIYNGTQTFDIFLGPDHINGFTTAAVGFGSNSATLADAGYIAETVANGWTTPTVDKFVLGNDGSGQYPLNGYVRRLTYWPVRLSNEVLQRITQ